MNDMNNANAVSTGAYTVSAADMCGEFRSAAYATFPQALETYRAWEGEFSGRRVCVMMCNEDRCDYDTNGLTDDEREALSE